MSGAEGEAAGTEPHQAAKKEALFREVNEQIETVNANLPADDPTMEVLCECDDPDCHEPVNITRAEYESVRAVPTSSSSSQAAKTVTSSASSLRTSATWSSKRPARPVAGPRQPIREPELASSQNELGTARSRGEKPR